MAAYAVGDRVLRLEIRAVRGATVVGIETDGVRTSYRIQYDEGGEGYWPEEGLEPET